MKKNVIVVGGGFAGLQFIRNLDKEMFDVLLIDKLNHHQFQPLFYQVATSQLEPSSISFPFRKVLEKHKNVRIRMAEVHAVNPIQNTIQTSIGEFNYDFLVIATGCKTNYFGNDELMKNVKSLKTTYQAITIRNAILETFEKILYVDEAEKEALFNIIIVGAGPTGVELAGAFAEIKRDVLPRDYPRIDFSKLKIILLEGGQATLSTFSKMSQEASRKYLLKLGVDLKTGVIVKHYDGETLSLENGESIKSKNVIWAAGLTGNLIDGFDKDIVLRGNRIKVDRTNKVNGYENIFAIGDIAYMETPLYPKGHPQVANVAINQAKNLAKNLKAMLTNKSLKAYEYNDLGSMATIGRNKAVVDLPFVRFKGYFAWYVWMFLHLMLILSVRNKLIIFINWTINYVTKNSSLRLILKND
jgi:NADH:ubiquinone reductase (H+-translocating)